MDKLIKPKKPTLKKPQPPRAPEEPLDYGDPQPLGKIYWYVKHYDQRDIVKKDILEDDEVLEIEISNGWLMIDGIDVSFYPKSETYDDDMVTYKEKLKEHKLKVKKFQPKLAEYTAVMAAYEVEYFAWKSQEAQEALDKARKNVGEAHG